MQYWLLKTEPEEWSWKDQIKCNKGGSVWDGVRNFQARNNLKAMNINDLCFFYHSVLEKKIVGIVRVVKEFYPDPSDKKNKFVMVDVKAHKKVPKPISLEQIKKDKRLKDGKIKGRP